MLNLWRYERILNEPSGANRFSGGNTTRAAPSAAQFFLPERKSSSKTKFLKGRLLGSVKAAVTPCAIGPASENALPCFCSRSRNGVSGSVSKESARAKGDFHK